MDGKKDAHSSTKNSLIIISAILHIATIVAVVFLYSQDGSIVNNYAEKSHSHTRYSDDSHSHSDYSDDSHSHSDYADDSHYHYDYADDSHSHSATDITYSSSDYGGYGSLQSEIDDLDSELGKKAKKRHTHSEYSPSYHSHY